jgi:hypothetical protein
VPVRGDGLPKPSAAVRAKTTLKRKCWLLSDRCARAMDVVDSTEEPVMIACRQNGQRRANGVAAVAATTGMLLSKRRIAGWVSFLYSRCNSRFGYAPSADAPVSNQVQNERKMRIASPGAPSSTVQGTTSYSLSPSFLFTD